MCLKTSKEKSHLLAYLGFCAFVLLLGCVLVLFYLLCIWCFWCAQNLFVEKKINKEFKTALIISFTLLQNSYYYKQNFFLSKSFSIITNVLYYNLFNNNPFNHHSRLYYNCFNRNPFQSSQPFSIITTLFSLLYQNLFHHNLFQSLYNL